MDTQPETVARAFLEALNEGRWEDAASLVAPATRQTLRAWMIEVVRRGDTEASPGTRSDTFFLTPATHLGVRSVAEAEALSDVDVLARFAAGVQPQRVMDHFADLHPGAKAPGPPIRLVRTLLAGTKSDGDNVTIRYRTRWHHGTQGAQSMGETNELQLTRTPEGWRVRDANLGGFGSGWILPPAEAMDWADPE